MQKFWVSRKRANKHLLFLGLIVVPSFHLERRISAGNNWIYFCVAAGTNQIPDTPLPEKAEKKPRGRPRRGPKSRGHAKRTSDSEVAAQPEQPVTGEGDASIAMEMAAKTEDNVKPDGEDEEVRMDVEEVTSDKKEAVKEDTKEEEKKDARKEEEGDAKEESPMDTTEAKEKDSEEKSMVEDTSAQAIETMEESTTKEDAKKMNAEQEVEKKDSDVEMKDCEKKDTSPEMTESSSAVIMKPEALEKKETESVSPGKKETSAEDKETPKTEDGDKKSPDQPDADKGAKSESDADKEVKNDTSKTESADVKAKPEPLHIQTKWDEIDISSALKTHTLYKKIPYKSRLEGFLDRRMKQHEAEQLEFQRQVKRYEAYQKAQKDKEQLEKLLEQTKNILANKKSDLGGGASIAGLKLITGLPDKTLPSGADAKPVTPKKEYKSLVTSPSAAKVVSPVKKDQEVRIVLSPSKVASPGLGLVSTTPVKTAAKASTSGGLVKSPQSDGQAMQGSVLKSDGSVVKSDVKPAVTTIKSQEHIQTDKTQVVLSKSTTPFSASDRSGEETTASSKPAQVVLQTPQSTAKIEAKPTVIAAGEQSTEREGIFSVLKNSSPDSKKSDADAVSVKVDAPAPSKTPTAMFSSRATEFYKPTSEEKVPKSFQAAYLSMLASVSSVPGIKRKGTDQDSPPKKELVKSDATSSEQEVKKTSDTISAEQEVKEELQGREAGNLVQEASGLSERGASEPPSDPADPMGGDKKEAGSPKESKDSNEQMQTDQINLPLLKEELNAVSNVHPCSGQSGTETSSEKAEAAEGKDTSIETIDDKMDVSEAPKEVLVSDLGEKVDLPKQTVSSEQAQETSAIENVIEEQSVSDDTKMAAEDQGISQAPEEPVDSSAKSDSTSESSASAESKKAVEIASAKVGGGITTVTIRRFGGVASPKPSDATPSTSAEPSVDCNHQSAKASSTDSSVVGESSAVSSTPVAIESSSVSHAPVSGSSSSCEISHGCGPDSSIASTDQTSNSASTSTTETSNVDTITTATSSSSAEATPSTSTPCGTSMGCGTPPQSPKATVGPCGTSMGCGTPPQSPTQNTASTSESTAETSGENETSGSTNVVCNHALNNAEPEVSSKTGTVTSTVECNHDTNSATMTVTSKKVSNEVDGQNGSHSISKSSVDASTPQTKTSEQIDQAESSISHATKDSSETVSSTAENTIFVSSSNSDNTQNVCRTEINSTKDVANSSMDQKSSVGSLDLNSSAPVNKDINASDKDALSTMLPALAPISRGDKSVVSSVTEADVDGKVSSKGNVAMVKLATSAMPSKTGTSIVSKALEAVSAQSGQTAATSVVQSKTLPGGSKPSDQKETTTTVVTTTVVTTVVTTQKVVTTTTTTKGSEGVKTEKRISASEALTKMVQQSKMAATTTGGKTTTVQFSQTALEAQIKKLEETLLLEPVKYPEQRDSCEAVYLASKYSKKKATKKIAKPLPLCRKFSTKSKQKSILVLPPQELVKLCRRAGNYEVEGFSYNCKNVGNYWPYPAPRPIFKICWRYRVQKLKSFAGVGLMLRILWSCMRWDDIAVKPPHGSVNTTTTDSEVIKSELIDKRDVMPSGLRSEYLLRRIITPIRMESDDRGR